MKYGYIRVSTHRQAMEGTSLDTQRQAVLNAGAERIVEDAGKSGKNLNREGMTALRIALRSGDTVIVSSLDRLGRSTANIAGIVEAWTHDGITLIAIKEGVNTATPAGRMTAQILAAVAEMERALILERTEAGRVAAAASGKTAHRKRSYTPARARKAAAMKADGWTISDLAARFHCGRATVYRMLAAAKEQEQ